MIYLTEGNTPLNEAYNDEIVQERNNTYQLTFRFPTSDPKWELLKEETFLTADDLHGEQDFYIFEVEKQQGYIQVYANQVISLLNNYIVSSIDVDRVSGTRALSALAGSITRANPFSFFSDIDDRHTLNIKDKNAMEVLVKDKHSILGQWGGDMVRNGYNLRLLKNGGSENESLFMYKKNLSSYQHKTSTKSLKTRITFKTTVKGEGEKAPDVDYVVVIDSPLLGKYSQIYEAVVEVNDQNVKDQASLIEYGKQYFRTSMCDMMEDNLEISVVGQSDVAVRMFDVVSIYHEWYGLDVRKKITKYTYSPMAKRLKSIGFGTFQSSLANAIGGIVNDAVLNESRNLHQIFEERLKKEIANADRAFDAEFAKREKDITDAIEQYKAKAEEVKQELSDTINQRFDSFDNGPLKEAKRKAEEALKNAGASSLLAQEAKQIGLDSIARLEAFKSQTTSAQTALSSDFDALKQTVTSEVNQASEYRRMTTEALSRMTGQMNGFATKSEVKQDIDGLTQTFAKMKVGGRNYYRDSEKIRTSTRFFSFPLHPYLSQENVGEIWTLSFDLKINEGGEIRPLHFYHYQNNRFGLKTSADITPSKEWQRFTFTGPVIFPNDDSRYSRGEMALYDYAGNNNYSVRRIKFEKGTLATDWSPAPEDTDSLITEAKATFEQTAQGLRTDLSAIQEYVNKDGQRQEALQRYTREENAKQATAVRELVNRDFVGKSTYQEDVRGLERRFEAITNPQNGSIATQIANYKKSVDGRFADISSLLSGKANQSDFQRVKETSQLYERILGNTENGIADKVARIAMTNQLFQVEVGKAFAEHQNLFLNSTLTKGFLGNNGIINVANAIQKEVTSDFISVDPNEKIIFQHWVTLPENGMAWTAWQFFDKNKNPIDNRKPGLNAYKTTVGKQHNINQITVPANAYFVRFSARMYDDGLIKVEKGSTPSDYSVAPNDALEAVKTVQRQLTGSWAVQNINSAGDIISGINLGANGHNRITGKLTHITGETLIDNAVIKSAMIDKLKTANFESGSVTTAILDAEAVTADKVRFDNAFIRKMITNDAFIEQLTSKQIFATKVESVVSSSTFLEAYQGRIGGFTLGQFDQGGGRWISGVNQFSVGMGNGAGYGVRTAFWANWGNNWNYAGPKAWNVNTDGKMYCRNEVGFYDQVDFSNSSRANFYGTTTFSRSPVFSNGIELGSKDVFGDGWNPKGGRNAVVWWNQVGSGSVKYWMEQKSDRRLKENITDTAVKALDKINKLRMVAFDFIESKKHEEIGLIAQEAETIVPRIVSRDPENPDGYLHIDYTALVPYLIKAIQELNQKIEKMEKTIA
jgi:phage minor structural protein, N-terminal domain protein